MKFVAIAFIATLFTACAAQEKEYQTSNTGAARKVASDGYSPTATWI